MKMEFQSREFLPDERRMMSMLRRRAEKAGHSRFRLYHYAIAGVLAGSCGWLAQHTGKGFLMFLFGTVAIIALGVIVFAPFEMAKLRRRHRDFLRRLTAFIDRGTVATLPVEATKITFVPEQEDENDLYIVELADGQELHIRDLAYNLERIFPCLRFELYDDEFFDLTGRRIRSLSERIVPVVISSPVEEILGDEIAAGVYSIACQCHENKD